MCGETFDSLANRLVESNCSFTFAKFSAFLIQITTSLALVIHGNRTTGPRVIPSATIVDLTPVFSKARHPETIVKP